MLRVLDVLLVNQANIDESGQLKSSMFQFADPHFFPSEYRNKSFFAQFYANSMSARVIWSFCHLNKFVRRYFHNLQIVNVIGKHDGLQCNIRLASIEHCNMFAAIFCQYFECIFFSFGLFPFRFRSMHSLLSFN